MSNSVRYYPSINAVIVNVKGEPSVDQIKILMTEAFSSSWYTSDMNVIWSFWEADFKELSDFEIDDIARFREIFRTFTRQDSRVALVGKKEALPMLDKYIKAVKNTDYEVKAFSSMSHAIFWIEEGELPAKSARASSGDA